MMPMLMHKGTLYLHPRAFPHLTVEDVKKMNELNVADAMTYLMGRNVVLGAPPPLHSIHPLSIHPLGPSRPSHSSHLLNPSPSASNASGSGSGSGKGTSPGGGPVAAGTARTGDAESVGEPPKEATLASDGKGGEEKMEVET
jgi:hypothetical protein